MAVTQAQVAQLYVALFNRAPEGAGFNAWVSAGATKTQAQIANDMLNSDAAIAYYGGSIDQDRDFVEMIYKNILGKDYSQDPNGINAWVKHLQLGNSRGDTLVKLFDVASSAAARAADPVAAKVFENKTEISKYMAEKIPAIDRNGSGDYNYTPFQEIIRTTNSTNLNEQKAKVDQLAGSVFHTLTTSEDTINGTAKPDVISGVISSVVSENTFNPEDKIDGGAENDTLSASMSTNFNGFTTGHLKNVENLNLTNISGTRKVFDATGVEGLRNIKTDGSSATRVINLATIVDLSAIDIKSGDILLTYSPTIVSGNSDEQNLTLDNVGAATPEGMMSNSISTTFSGIEKLNITTKGSASYIKDVNVKNVAVKGSAALNVTLAGDKDSPNGITTTFDASALVANLTADLVGGFTTLEDVKGGKGDDWFKANINSASVGIFKVNGGDGNDTLEFNDLDGGLDTARKLESTSIENLIFKNSEISTGTPAVLDLEKSPDVVKLTVGLKSGQSGKLLNVINSKIDTLNYITNDGRANKITIDSTALTAINYVNETTSDSLLASITAPEAAKLDVTLKGIISGIATIKADKAKAITLTMDSKDVDGKNLNFDAALASSMKVTTVQEDSKFQSAGNKLKSLKSLDVTTAGKFELNGNATADDFATLSTINLKGTNEKSSATVVAGVQSTVAGARSSSIQDINLTADNLQATVEKHHYQSLHATLNTQGTINVFLNNNTQGDVEIDVSNAGSLNIENNSVNVQHLILSSTNHYTDAIDTVTIKGGTAHKATIGNIAANKIDIDLSKTLGLTSFKDNGTASWMVANDIKLKISHITGTNEETIDLRMAGGRDFKADITGSVKSDKIKITKDNNVSGIENIKVSGDLGAGYDEYTLNTNSTGSTLRTIDLSGLKNVEKGTITLDALNAKNLISLKATDGEDTVTLLNNMLSETTIRNLDVSLGAGDDTITFGTLTANKTITVSGGAGSDIFDVSNAKTDANASKYVVVSDVGGGDKIKFGAVSSIEKIEDDVVKNKTTLKEAINAAIAANQTPTAGDIADKVFYFTYGGDTYVVHNAASTVNGTPDTLTTDDTIVKLAGVRADDLIATYDSTQGTFNIN